MLACGPHYKGMEGKQGLETASSAHGVTEVTPTADCQKPLRGDSSQVWVSGLLLPEVQAGDFNTMTPGAQGDTVKAEALNLGLILPRKLYP